MTKTTGAILFFLLFITRANAQETMITGNWYSKDGSRQHHIRQKDNEWEALLIRSDRKKDTAGKIILSHLQKRKNRYKGVIYSVTDGAHTSVTIRASRKNREVLILKLKRMLLLDVTIRWYRDPT